MTTDTTETAVARDNIQISACDVAIARFIEPCWDALPERGRAQALAGMAKMGIGQRASAHNTTCTELDQLRVDALKESAPSNETISELAVGTDNTTPAHSNTSLNNEHARTDVTEFVDSGSTLTSQFFLSKTEGNGAGSDLVELGMYAGDNSDYFLNHSTFAGITKTSSKAVTFEVDLTFTNA